MKQCNTTEIYLGLCIGTVKLNIKTHHYKANTFLILFGIKKIHCLLYKIHIL